MRERITDEIFFALGAPKQGWQRRAFGWIFRFPTARFSYLFAEADEAVGRAGLPAGCAVIAHNLVADLQARGLEHLPRQGPLIIASNHPGAYDSVCIASYLPRPDLKIILSDTNFYRAMPNTHPRFLYVTDDSAGRMLALRGAIEHLQSGSALLQFGTGLIEPDPAYASGAEESLGEWSPSLEIMLRKVPDTQLVLSIASGVLLPKFARHPFTRLHKKPLNQRRLAEFIQVIQQLIFPRSVCVVVRVSFAAPVSAAELAGEGSGRRLMPAIQARARVLLAEHMRAWYPGLSV
jgi:hypothetical protein